MMTYSVKNSKLEATTMVTVNDKRSNFDNIFFQKAYLYLCIYIFLLLTLLCYYLLFSNYKIIKYFIILDQFVTYNSIIMPWVNIWSKIFSNKCQTKLYASRWLHYRLQRSSYFNHTLTLQIKNSGKTSFFSVLKYMPYKVEKSLTNEER